MGEIIEEKNEAKAKVEQLDQENQMLNEELDRYRSRDVTTGGTKEVEFKRTLESYKQKIAELEGLLGEKCGEGSRPSSSSEPSRSIAISQMVTDQEEFGDDHRTYREMKMMEERWTEERAELENEVSEFLIELIGFCVFVNFGRIFYNN